MTGKARELCDSLDQPELAEIQAIRLAREDAESYHRMEGLPEQVQRDMDGATSLDQVRKVAAETEQLMREENSDWFGVMRFHDMELIT